MDLLARLSNVFHARSEEAAIVSTDVTLTYGQLDLITQQVAEGLLRRGIGAENVVTIETSSKLEAICLMLGVVRAGGAYCVIPVDYPDQRKQLMRTKVQAVATLHGLVEAGVTWLADQEVASASANAEAAAVAPLAEQQYYRSREERTACSISSSHRAQPASRRLSRSKTAQSGKSSITSRFMPDK